MEEKEIGNRNENDDCQFEKKILNRSISLCGSDQSGITSEECSGGEHSSEIISNSTSEIGSLIENNEIENNNIIYNNHNGIDSYVINNNNNNNNNSKEKKNEKEEVKVKEKERRSDKEKEIEKEREKEKEREREERENECADNCRAICLSCLGDSNKESSSNLRVRFWMRLDEKKEDSVKILETTNTENNFSSVKNENGEMKNIDRLHKLLTILKFASTMSVETMYDFSTGNKNESKKDQKENKGPNPVPQSGTGTGTETGTESRPSCLLGKGTYCTQM